MKKGLHPNYYPQATVVCSCGNTFTVGSTVASMRVAICHKCHPIFTGQEKLIDTEGLVQKFQKRQAAAEKLKKEKVAHKQVRKEKKEERERPRSLREMIKLAKQNRE